jgi:DNA-binding response OmpR family regulator
MLTAKDADIEQVIGLEAGADDYVAKPAEPMVLLARIRALLRRAEAKQPAAAGAVAATPTPAATPDIVLGSLRVSEAHRVWLDGHEITLTTQEFELLYELARSAGTILSREDLFKRIRGIDYDGLDRSIDGRISKLRKKLGDDADAPKRIRTIWGKGYLLVPDAW